MSSQCSERILPIRNASHIDEPEPRLPGNQDPNSHRATVATEANPEGDLISNLGAKLVALPPLELKVTLDRCAARPKGQCTKLSAADGRTLTEFLTSRLRFDYPVEADGIATLRPELE